MCERHALAPARSLQQLEFSRIEIFLQLVIRVLNFGLEFVPLDIISERTLVYF